MAGKPQCRGRIPDVDNTILHGTDKQTVRNAAVIRGCPLETVEPAAAQTIKTKW